MTFYFDKILTDDNIKCLTKQEKYTGRGKMIVSQKFKEFPDAIASLKLNTANVAIVEVNDEEMGYISHIITANNYLANEIRKKLHFYSVNDIGNFPTLYAFQSADEIQDALKKL